MPWLRSHRSASFLKSSLSSMKRTRVMSAGKEGGMRILCKAPRTIHRKLKTGVAVGSRNAQGLARNEQRRDGRLHPLATCAVWQRAAALALASLGSPRGSRQVPQDFVGSVEREGVPGDAVPRDAIPCDAVPCDAVPHDAVPGNAVPGNAVPGEVVPGDAIPYQGVPSEQEPGNAAEQR